eukprot:766870-Hanusia_phi.AAC.2
MPTDMSWLIVLCAAALLPLAGASNNNISVEICPSNFFVLNSTCTACPDGSFSDGTTTFCYKCCSDGICQGVVLEASYWSNESSNCTAPNTPALQSRGGIPFGSSSLDGFCTSTGSGIASVLMPSGIYCWTAINDGIYGLSSSWIPNSDPSFVGIVFESSVRIKHVVISIEKANIANESFDGTTYVLEYMPANMPKNFSDDFVNGWISLGQFAGNAPRRTVYTLQGTITASAIRILINQSNWLAISEIEVYSDTETPPSDVCLSDYGEFGTSANCSKDCGPMAYYDPIQMACTFCPALTVPSRNDESSCGCVAGYFSSNPLHERCLSCPYMKTTIQIGAMSILDCVDYQALIAYTFEQFDNASVDSSGFGNDAVEVYDVIVASPGRRGDGRAKFSSGGFIKASQNLDLELLRTSSGLTISFWFVFDITNPSHIGCLLSFADESLNRSTSRLMTYSNSTDGQLYFVTEGVSGAYTFAHPFSMDDAWHYIVWSFESDQALYARAWQIWIDGVQIVSFTDGIRSELGIVVFPSDRSFYIGKCLMQNASFSGSIDEFRVYNFSFTSGDVQRHYQPLYSPSDFGEDTFVRRAVLIASIDFPGLINYNTEASLYPSSWDELFASLLLMKDHVTIVQVCHDCDTENWLLFYKRIRPVPSHEDYVNNKNAVGSQKAIYLMYECRACIPSDQRTVSNPNFMACMMTQCPQEKFQISCPENFYGPLCRVQCNRNATCSGRGECLQNGTCACEDGWGGERCSMCTGGYGEQCEARCEDDKDCSGHG